MKIQDKINTIETSGLSETGSFTIKASPHAFHILSSGLYSNKIRAVIRELSCNAVDAHTDAKTVQPIEIKLPNELDKQFYVKDYGTGLSHEQVMKLYTTYFESTKQDSNDFIGGLGVGSKSPFAYTDSFTVESRQNGKIRLYAAYLDEHNMPAISKMSEEDTTEPNGLTIGFPVSPSDFKEFAKEAEDVFRSFKQLPVIKGAALKIKQPNLKKLKKLTNTVYSLNNEESFPWKNCVRMGNVVYPLNIKQLAKDNKWLKWMLMKNGIFIDAPIGTYAIAASREQLQYDPVTIKKITNDMSLFYNAWLEDTRQFLAKLDTLPCEYDKKYETRKWLLQQGLDEDFYDEAYYDNDDNEEDYIISVEEILKSLKQKHQLDIKLVGGSELINIDFINTNLKSVHVRKRSTLKYQTLSRGSSTQVFMDYYHHVNLIAIDIPTNRNTLNAYMQNKDTYQYKTLASADITEGHEVFYIISPKKDTKKEDFDKELESIKTKIGITNVTFTSSLPVVKMPRSAVTGTTTRIAKDEVSGNLIYQSTIQNWISSNKNTTLTKSDTFVWIPYVKKTNTYDGKELKTNEYNALHTTIQALHTIENELGIRTTKIYAINPKNVEVLKQFNNAMTLDTYLKQLLETKKLKTILSTKNELSVIKDDAYIQQRNKNNLSELSTILKTTPVGIQLKQLLNAVEVETSLTRLCISMNIFSKQDLGNMSAKKIKEIDFEKIHTKITDRYPLLGNNVIQLYHLTPKLKKELSDYVVWRDSTATDTFEL